jgi:hypothetical protein
MILTIIAVCLFFIALPTILGAAVVILFAIGAILASIPKWFWTIAGMYFLLIVISLLSKL